MKRTRSNLRTTLQWGVGLSAGAAWLAAAVLCLRDRLPRDTGLVILLLLATAVLTGCAWALNRKLFRPMDELADLVANWSSTVPEDMEKLIDGLPGPAGELGEVLYGQMSEVERRLDGIEEKTREETERTVRSGIAEDICRSALPQALKDYPSRQFFRVTGLARPGQRARSVFYDYFYIDPGLLGISVGQVPEQSVAVALNMVAVQTAIRSHLSLGRSLEETMSDVNAQMYDCGAEGELQVLAGTLDTGLGVFSFVNAGSCAPLLMQDEARYERLDSPAFPPLGRAREMRCQAQEVRLKQGSRLFLYTEGLAAAEDSRGTPFGTRELRSVLNRSLSRKDPEQSLRFLADEAAAFCPADDAHPGYAALLLEYRRGERELTRCRVPGTPEHTGEVLDFFKNRLEDSGIQRRSYARIAVLAEELVTLCCRGLEDGAELGAECDVAPDDQSVTIRMSGPFHGRNPLAEDAPGGPAVDFIRKHGEYVSFQPGEAEDAVSVVCFL